MDDYKNDITDIETIITRYLASEATESEMVTLKAWIEESDENRISFFRQKDLWHAMCPVTDPASLDLSLAEQRVRKLTGMGQRNRLSRVARLSIHIAAAAFIPLLATLLWVTLKPRPAQTVTLATAYGCTAQSTLPDGTVVWLNANSRLEYDPTFYSGRRNVSLSGEAFFKVMSDKDHPFDVSARGVTVTATGTEFNVNAYDPYPSVTLVSGRINVSDSHENIPMIPGQHLSFTDGGHPVMSSQTDTDRWCSWRDGMLIFDNEPLGDMCRRLENIYNVTFEITDPEASDLLFRLVLRGETINEITCMLERVAPVSCTISDAPGDDPSQPRQLVTISYRK